VRLKCSTSVMSRSCRYQRRLRYGSSVRTCDPYLLHMTVAHMSAIDVRFLWGMLSQAVAVMLSSLDLQQEEARGGGSMRSVAPAVPGPITVAQEGSQRGPSSAPSETSAPMVRLQS
jgi:hypothetical protein